MTKKKDDISHWFFLLLLVLILFLTWKIISPFLSYVVVSMVLVFAAQPVNRWLRQRIANTWITSAILMALTIIIVVIPAFFLVRSLIEQGLNTISSINLENIDKLSMWLETNVDVTVDLTDTFAGLMESAQDFLINGSISFISGIADAVIGFLVMFFVMFYLFKNGTKIYKGLIDVIPLKEEYKKVLVGETQLVTNAVLYGQILIALVQGILGGLGFVIFGIPNPVFWGFIMGILSLLPLVGTPIVFVPAGILQLFAGNYVSGVGILLYGGILVMNIDNFGKPLIISERSRLDPILIILGVLGGIKAFGFIGIVIGPLVLSLLIAFLQVFKQDFKPSQELEKATQNTTDYDVFLPLPAEQHFDKKDFLALFSGKQKRLFKKILREEGKKELTRQEAKELARTVAKKIREKDSKKIPLVDTKSTHHPMRKPK